MTCTVLEYENLISKTFSDSNASRPTSGIVPRWQRKQMQKKRQETKEYSSNDCPSNDPSPKDGVSSTRNDSKSTSTSNSRDYPQPLSQNGVPNIIGGDRFIPNRAAMDLEVSAHSIRKSDSSSDLPSKDSKSSVDKEEDSSSSEFKSVLSSEMLGMDDISSRILAFKEKAPEPRGDTFNNLNILYSSSGSSYKPCKSTKIINRHISSAPCRILDAPDLLDDYYLNLISWSDTNMLAVALGQTVYLWNATTGTIQELFTQEGDSSQYVSSVSWVQQGGNHLAVGTSTGKAQLWDVNQCKQLRSMDGHTERIGSLSWNNHILSTGGRDAIVVNHDVRMPRHNVATLVNHSQEICGLSWNPEGTMLASGGNDNMLNLWEGTTNTTPKYTCTDHQAAVKALAWSPHERNLLASGGGSADRCIKFWNGQTGALLNSIDTGSQVCALQWNKHEREILSGHGFARNQLCLWKYPSMVKVKELEGHTSRVLHMASSPDGCSVVSAAADETLRFWDVFATPGKAGKRIGDSGRGVGRKKFSNTMRHIR